MQIMNGSCVYLTTIIILADVNTVKKKTIQNEFCFLIMFKKYWYKGLANRLWCKIQ